MTTETNGTSSSNSSNFKPYTAKGPQILAHLLLLQQRHTLPDWTSLEVRAGIKTVDLRFAAPADVERWIVAMGRDPEHINRSTRTDGSVQAWIVVKLGSWTIDCEGTTARSSTLDAETVTALEDVAEPRCPSCGEPVRLLESGAVGHAGDDQGNPCEQPSRIPAKRVDELLVELNKLTQFPAEARVDWWDWVTDVPEFDKEATAAAADTGELHLVDGTVLVWRGEPDKWKRSTDWPVIS